MVILNQCYNSNCWWIGKLVNVENDKLTIANTIYIERGNGKIYNASPDVRNINYGNKDSFYLVSNGWWIYKKNINSFKYDKSS